MMVFSRKQKKIFSSFLQSSGWKFGISVLH